MRLIKSKQFVRVVHILSRTLHDHIVKTWIFLCDNLTFNQGIMPFVVFCLLVKGNKKMGGNFHSPFYLGRKMRHGRYKISVEKEEKKSVVQ